MRARWFSGAAVLAGAVLFGAAVGGVAGTDGQLQAATAAPAPAMPVVQDHDHGCRDHGSEL